MTVYCPNCTCHHCLVIRNGPATRVRTTTSERGMFTITRTLPDGREVTDTLFDTKPRAEDVVIHIPANPPPNSGPVEPDLRNRHERRADAARRRK